MTYRGIVFDRDKENDFHLDAFRSIARDHPLGSLRWALIHLQSIDEARLKALRELGAGASAQTWTYFGNGGGPPFRRIVDAGIPAGVVAPRDPPPTRRPSLRSASGRRDVRYSLDARRSKTPRPSRRSLDQSSLVLT